MIRYSLVHFSLAKILYNTGIHIRTVSWQGSPEETRRLMKSGLPSHKEISKRKFVEGYVEKKNCVLFIPFILSGSPNDGLQSGIKLLRHGNFGEQNSIYLSIPAPLHSKLGFLLFSTGSSNSGSTQFHGGAGGGGVRTPGNSWWGCADPIFRPKNVTSHISFQTWSLGRNYVIIT